MFVCFAPRENPTIAIAVVIENGGAGATWAAPIASLMIEKYISDTLRTERLKEVDRIANASLLPFYLPRLQYKEDSIRARKWFKMTNDSNYIRKYLNGKMNPPKPPTQAPSPEEKVPSQIGLLYPDNKRATPSSHRQLAGK